MIHVPVMMIGAGGHARVLISSLRAMKREVKGILTQDVTSIGRSVAGVDILGDDEKVIDYLADSIELVNGIGSVNLPEKRKEIFLKFKKRGYFFSSVIHPKAIVMDDVKLGEGVQIMAGAVVQSGCSLGDNVIVNTGAIVDHDCIIGAHAHIASGAVLSGAVEVGDMAHIGTAAAVIQGIKVGECAVIGAGAVVIKDIAANARVAGVPARYIERR